MNRVFFNTELESVAIYWRIERSDGVALGFTTHDRDLRFDGLLHRSAPGLVPSAIRRNSGLELDNAEVRGALSHDSIRAKDLAMGRYDNARVEIGTVDWQTLERAGLYSGKIGPVSYDGINFESDLRSAKSDLQADLVPRTSPTCRAKFCGPGCNLSSQRFTHNVIVDRYNQIDRILTFSGGPTPSKVVGGFVRWVDGPYSGIEMTVLNATEGGLLLDSDFEQHPSQGQHALLREGCDHTFATCQSRFENALNFRGEPFLPGNDALLRYPTRAG